MTANHLMAAQIVEGMTVKDDDQKPSSELTRAAVRAFTLQVRSDLGLPSTERGNLSGPL